MPTVTINAGNVGPALLGGKRVKAAQVTVYSGARSPGLPGLCIRYRCGARLSPTPSAPKHNMRLSSCWRYGALSGQAVIAVQASLTNFALPCDRAPHMLGESKIWRSWR